MKYAVALSLLPASLLACQNVSDATHHQTPLAPAAPARPPAAAPPAIAGVTPVSGDFAIKNFTFASGEKLPELRIHYMTLGTVRRDATGHVTNAVLVMHGTTDTGEHFADKSFADVLFGPGQALDLIKYYVILPDGIGHG